MLRSLVSGRPTPARQDASTAGTVCSWIAAELLSAISGQISTQVLSQLFRSGPGRYNAIDGRSDCTDWCQSHVPCLTCLSIVILESSTPSPTRPSARIAEQAKHRARCDPALARTVYRAPSPTSRACLVAWIATRVNTLPRAQPSNAYAPPCTVSRHWLADSLRGRILPAAEALCLLYPLQRWLRDRYHAAASVQAMRGTCAAVCDALT